MSKKWFWVIALIAFLMIFFFVPGTVERSISNFYIIPAGSISLFHNGSFWHPAQISFKSVEHTANTTCFIDINPLENHEFDGNFMISGTTNADSGRNVSLIMNGECNTRMPFPCSISHEPNSSYGNSICCKGVAETKVVHGEDSINTWLLFVNQTVVDPQQLAEGNYSLQVNIDSDCVSNISIFSLH